MDNGRALLQNPKYLFCGSPVTNCLPKVPNDYLTVIDTLCTIRDAGSYCLSGKAACTAPEPIEESSLILRPTQDVLAFWFTQ